MADGTPELADYLRTWRDRLTPAEAGLPEKQRRRAPGLRRQEVAELAGVSVGYLTRLEQGRAVHPSAQVLGALARALRLSTEEQELAFRLAGHQPPGTGHLSRHITPGVQRMLDRLQDLPILVLDAAWDPVAANPLATALLGEQITTTGREGNIAWRHFTGVPSRVTHEPDALVEYEHGMVAELQTATGTHPDCRHLAALVADLRRVSPRFAELWGERPVAPQRTSHKAVLHPEVGRIEVDCDVLHVVGSDLKIVMFSCAPGSEDAEKLRLVGVLGLQTFAHQPG